jgi:hypothetical protein
MSGVVIDRLEQRVRDALAKHSLYEAEQLANTLNARLVASQQLDRAQSLLGAFALDFASAGAMTPACKLGLLLVQGWKKHSVPCTEERIAVVLSILRVCSDEAKTSKTNLGREALQWSSKSRSRGHPLLHLELARMFARVGEFESAQNHFLFAEVPEEHAKMLVEWAGQGFRGEADLFVVRCVLQYLALENLKSANIVFRHFSAAYETLDSPLINFGKFRMHFAFRDSDVAF